MFPLEKARIYIKAADLAMKHGHLESAELHLRNAFANYIKSPNLTDIIVEVAECSLLLGIVLERRGNLVEAELLLIDAAKRLEKGAAFVPLFILRNILLNAGRIKEANKVFLTKIKNPGKAQ